MIQAAGVSGTVRECLIILTHCAVAGIRKYQIVPTHCTRTQCWLVLTSQRGPGVGSAPPHMLTTTFSPTPTTVSHPASWLMTCHLKHFMLALGAYIDVAPAYISTFILYAHALCSDCYHLSVTFIIFCLFLPQMSYILDDLLERVL